MRQFFFVIMCGIFSFAEPPGDTAICVVSADSPENLYFEKDENFATTPAKLRKVTVTTERKILDEEQGLPKLPAMEEISEYEFDVYGYRTSATGTGKGGLWNFRIEITYTNVYEKGKVQEVSISCPPHGIHKKRVYEYSGLGTKVTERYYNVDWEEEDDWSYKESVYDWRNDRLKEKTVFYGLLGEHKSEYQYWDYYADPWCGKLKKVINTIYDRDKSFKLELKQQKEVLCQYDEKGRLKEEIFFGPSGRFDFINLYDARGDCVEIKAYYADGLVASKEISKHTYEKVNGVELRTRTETTMLRLEYKDREDGTYEKTEIPHYVEFTTYKYEFYK